MRRQFVLRLRRPAFTGARTPVATVGRSAGRLLAVCVTATLVSLVVGAATTQTEAGQRIADLILFGRSVAGPAGTSTAEAMLSTMTLASAVIAALGIAGLGLARGGFGLSIAACAAIAGANLTSQLLKDAIERPDFLGPYAYAAGNSFPSGTVTLAASIGLASILVVPRRLRGIAGLEAAAITGVVGVSVVTAGWHRLADAVGAIMIALAWTALAGGVLAQLQGWMPRRTWRTGLGRGTIVTGGLVGVVAVAAGGLAVASLLVDTTPVAAAFTGLRDAPRAFWAAIVVVAGTALVASSALVWALHGLALELPRRTDAG